MAAKDEAMALLERRLDEASAAAVASDVERSDAVEAEERRRESFARLSDSLRDVKAFASAAFGLCDGQGELIS